MDTTDMTMTERDAKIMGQLAAGIPIKTIAADFHLTEPRIYQIRKREAAKVASA